MTDIKNILPELEEVLKLKAKIEFQGFEIDNLKTIIAGLRDEINILNTIVKGGK